MHGALDRALCADCGHRWPAPAVMAPADPCPACSAPRTRPDVVWFGEIPYHMPEIERVLVRARIFAAIGTSGNVWPAAGFAATARRRGARCVEMNLAPSEVSEAFHDHRYGPATEVVPAWVADILSPR